MRILVFIFSLLIIGLACKQEGDNAKTTEEAQINEEKKNIPQGVNQDWVSFENASGKKPGEVGLMKIPDLQSRLKNLLKKEYDTFQKDWQEEFPIMVEDRIICAMACQTGDCKANKYMVFLDVADNNINVIQFAYGRVRSWEERAIIGLPSKLLEQYEKVRKDQGL